jgi:hypothetical protein
MLPTITHFGHHIATEDGTKWEGHVQRGRKNIPLKHISLICQARGKWAKEFESYGD